MSKSNAHRFSGEFVRRGIQRRTARFVLVEEDVRCRGRVVGQRFERRVVALHVGDMGFVCAAESTVKSVCSVEISEDAGLHRRRSELAGTALRDRSGTLRKGCAHAQQVSIDDHRDPLTRRYPAYFGEFSDPRTIISTITRSARINAMRYVLGKFDYDNKDHDVVGQADPLIVGRALAD
jgi:hypothetical protein